MLTVGASVNEAHSYLLTQLSDLMFWSYFQGIMANTQLLIRLSGMFLAGIQLYRLFKVYWIPGQARKDIIGIEELGRMFRLLS